MLGLNLVAVIWQLNAAEGLFAAQDDRAARECVLRARRIAAEALREIRCAVEMDSYADSEPVATCLEEVVRTATCGSDAVVRFIGCGQPTKLSSGVCSQVRRVVLEAVTNAIRHAQARAIEVELNRARDAIQVAVRDDGRGFLVAQADGDGGFGLRGMRQRAARIGAELTVRSAPGRGTEVRLIIPAPTVRLD